MSKISHFVAWRSGDHFCCQVLTSPLSLLLAFLAFNHVYIVYNVISNSHEVFQPVESDAYIGSNPGSHKAVPLSKMKAGDKVHRSFVEMSEYS